MSESFRTPEMYLPLVVKVDDNLNLIGADKILINGDFTIECQEDFDIIITSKSSNKSFRITPEMEFSLI